MEVKPNGLPISSPGQLPEFFILLKDSLKTFRLPFPFFQRWEHNVVKGGLKPRSGSGSLVFTFWLCLWTRGVKQAFAAHHWHFMSNNHTREWKLTEDEARSGSPPHLLSRFSLCLWALLTVCSHELLENPRPKRKWKKWAAGFLWRCLPAHLPFVRLCASLSSLENWRTAAKSGEIFL